jgi:hypothetical protein
VRQPHSTSRSVARRSRRRRSGTVALLAVVLALLGAGRAAAALPSSMAALGDSLTRGYGAGGTAADYPAESWSTGTDSAVSSHYLRLLAQNAAISG